MRFLSRRHPEVAESGSGRFTNTIWMAIRRDRAGCLRELEEARLHPDPWTRSMAVMMQAMFNENEGHVEQMVDDLTLALDGFRQLGERWGMSLALRGLASYHSSSGDHAAALEDLTEALRLIGELGTTEGVSQLLAQAAFSRADLGDRDGGRAELLRSLQLAEENGSRGGQGLALVGLSGLARRTGRLDEALELGEKTYSLLDANVERMAPHGQAIVLAQLCRVAVARNDLAAQEHGRRSMGFAITTEDMPLASTVAEVAADVALLDDDPEYGARLMGLAAALRGMRTQPDADVRRTVARLREILGADRYDTAYEAGARLTRDDAIDELRKRFSSS